MDGQVVLDLEKDAGAVGLKMNTRKGKVLNLTGQRTLPICIIERNIEGVDQFVYLGSFASADCGTAGLE